MVRWEWLFIFIHRSDTFALEMGFKKVLALLDSQQLYTFCARDACIEDEIFAALHWIFLFLVSLSEEIHLRMLGMYMPSTTTFHYTHLLSILLFLPHKCQDSSRLMLEWHEKNTTKRFCSFNCIFKSDLEWRSQLSGRVFCNG